MTADFLQAFREASADGRFVLQRCHGCGARRWPPREVCSRCHSRLYSWEPASGEGAVASFAVVHRAFDPDFAEDVPYVIALVALDSVLYLANVVDCEPASVSVGMRVTVVFRPTRKGLTLPQFRPA